MANEQEAAVVAPTGSTVTVVLTPTPEAPVPVVAVAAPTGPEAPAAAASVVGTEVQKIEAAVKALEEKAVKFATEARVEITTEEKLFMTKMEVGFLKAQLEISNATKVVENAQKQYTMFIEGLTKKYVINPLTHQFNNIEQVFTKKA